jgi:hypothetical protein
MTMSLKSYVPALARTLGMPTATVYERQRSLTRLDLLDPGAASGPGSGVQITSSAKEVALLIIACLASDTIAAAGTRARAVAEATPVNEKYCPFTHMGTFGSALARVLTSTAQSRRVIEIKISRSAARAEIVYRDIKMKQRISAFVGSTGADEPAIAVAATLKAKALQAIAADVQAMLHLLFDEQDRREVTPEPATSHGGVTTAMVVLTSAVQIAGGSTASAIPRPFTARSAKPGRNCGG